MKRTLTLATLALMTLATTTVSADTKVKPEPKIGHITVIKQDKAVKPDMDAPVLKPDTEVYPPSVNDLRLVRISLFQRTPAGFDHPMDNYWTFTMRKDTLKIDGTKITFQNTYGELETIQLRDAKSVDVKVSHLFDPNKVEWSRTWTQK